MTSGDPKGFFWSAYGFDLDAFSARMDGLLGKKPLGSEFSHIHLCEMLHQGTVDKDITSTYPARSPAFRVGRRSSSKSAVFCQAAFVNELA